MINLINEQQNLIKTQKTIIPNIEKRQPVNKLDNIPTTTTKKIKYKLQEIDIDQLQEQRKKKITLHPETKNKFKSITNLLHRMYICLNVFKQMTDVELLRLHTSFWDHLTVCGGVIWFVLNDFLYLYLTLQKPMTRRLNWA